MANKKKHGKMESTIKVAMNIPQANHLYDTYSVKYIERLYLRQGSMTGQYVWRLTLRHSEELVLPCGFDDRVVYHYSDLRKLLAVSERRIILKEYILHRWNDCVNGYEDVFVGDSEEACVDFARRELGVTGSQWRALARNFACVPDGNELELYISDKRWNNTRR